MVLSERDPARARLREALAPPIVEIGDARQKASLLRRSERVDHGPTMLRRRAGVRAPAPAASRPGRCIADRAPARAAPSTGQMRHGPALRVQDAGPGDEVFLAGVMAFHHLAGSAPEEPCGRTPVLRSRKASSSSVKRRSMVVRPGFPSGMARRLGRSCARPVRGRRARLISARSSSRTASLTACRPACAEGCRGSRGRRAFRAGRSCRRGTPAALRGRSRAPVLQLHEHLAASPR